MKKVLIGVLVLIFTGIMLAETVSVSAKELEVRVINEEVNDLELIFECGSFTTLTTNIDGEEWQQIYLEGEGNYRQRGFAQLPFVSRDAIIGQSSSVKVELISAEYETYAIMAAPSKGILFRSQNPEEVSYEFNEIYNEDIFWPQDRVTLGEPYILRDHRGINFRINPFSYNGVRNELRFYTSLHFRIIETGETGSNIKEREITGITPQFREIYKKHFINYTENRYDTIEELAGRMLIISYGDFMDEMQPFIDWKIQKGIAADIVDVSSIGNNSTSIQNYIESEYEQDDGLVWVLLVGDGAEVATKTYSGAGGDPQYSYLEGNDSYAEIFIGRFSAETESEVTTQVERSIYYERDVDETSGDWMQKGVGIASSQGSGIGHYGEADYVHIGYIRDDLLDYGYLEVDEIYDTNGGNASDVSNALNEGRGIINYCGHGSNYSWSTTGFNVTYVNALTNDYKLPFICSVACVNGNFTGRTCFAEAWVRATNGDAPTGAIAIFASSINQSWAPPMYAQDESVDLMCADDLNTIGGLWFNGVSYMLDESNATDMAKTWHIFGDPSLQVRSMVPEAINANCASTVLFEQETYTVPVGFEGALACLSYDGEIISQAYSEADGNAYLFLADLPEEPVSLTLTITAYNKITQIEDVELVIGTGPFVQMLSYNLVSGDDNDMYAGEYASLGITVVNIGSEAAEEIEFTISSECEYISFSDAVEIIPEIGIDQMLTLEECFSFTISEEALNETPVTFNIEAVSGENTWNYTIGEFIFAEEGLITFDEEINMSLGINESGSSELTFRNNNFAGDISYSIMIDETTGGRSIEGSTLTCDLNDFTPGETVDWTFTCTNNSPDWEWIKDIQIDFPDGVIVNSTSDFVGGSDDLEFLGDLGNGATCIWHGESASGWGYLHNDETATATVNVSISSGFSGDVSLSWQLTGDDYGSDPHMITGEIVFTSNALPISWLEIENVTGTLAPGEEITEILEFNTLGLEAGVYTADVIISSESDNLIIPVTLNVDMGTVVYGDIDDNGTVESYDSSLLLQYVVGLDPQGAPLPWEDWRIIRADVDGNGNVESYDAALILQYVVELITEFPAENGRLHIPPQGSVDIRKTEEEGNSWLELYTRGEVYAMQVMVRSKEAALGIPQVAEGISSAYLIDNGRHNYALASAEAFSNTERVMQIPLEASAAGELEIYLKVNCQNSSQTIILEGEEPDIPEISSLLGNYPNPFNPLTEISFFIAEESQVEIDIYNIRGQLVRNLINENKASGMHKTVWNGLNNNREAVSSGTYICLLRSSNGIQSRKMVLMK